MFDMLDELCAEELEVDTFEFVEKIESTTEYRRKIIIMYLLEGDPKKIEQAKRCFKLIKN